MLRRSNAMTTTRLFRPLLIAAAVGLICPLFAATAKQGQKVTPPAKAAEPMKTPALRIDNSPVADGGKSGIVMTYADVLDPVQKAVVSVYSTKIIKERIAIDPFF